MEFRTVGWDEPESFPRRAWGFPGEGISGAGEGQMQRQMQMQGWEVNDNVAVLKIEPRDAEIGRLFVKIEEGVRNIQE